MSEGSSDIEGLSQISGGSHGHYYNFEFREEAIPLITYSTAQQSKFQTEFNFNPEGVAFLRNLEGPIAVVSVAGLYRTGKSYLLNRIILNRSSGFGVGSTVNACTKGIWVWAKPIRGTTPDGSPCQVVIVDSEGIGAIDEDTDHDTRIFALAVLISSYFLYNSVGSIDEEALQNLSLVVDLTKHIHIKSNQTEEADCEDYAAYFPSFMWIVRDFSLRLVDPEGEAISPKEYLEMALHPQKGFSDSVEDKNRIRRLLKNFFKERDCCTLVRPISGEQDLQNLAEKDIDDLRPEFVEQMLQLRNRVLNRVKPKQLHGKPLNGEMLAGLIGSYVNAINEGAVPSIESAWSYICKSECAKAVEEAQDIYERVILANVDARFPLSEDELRLYHREAKESAIEQFQLKAVGNEMNGYLTELKNIISEKYNALKADNEMETSQCVQQYLHENYQIIVRRLENREFKSLGDFEKEFRAFQKFFMEHGPQGPNRREIMQEFCLQKYSEATDYFNKLLVSEYTVQVDVAEDKYQRVEQELREAKQEFYTERDDLQRRLTSAESERSELSIKESSLREQLESMKQEQIKMEHELRQALKEARSESLQQVEDATSKAWQFEDKMKEMERKLYQMESEFSEQKQLLEQKLAYYETSLEESRKREKDYLNQLNTQKKEHNNSLKELHNRHDSQIKGYQQRLDFETERANDLERQLEDKEHMLDREKTSKEELGMNNQSILKEANSKYEYIRSQMERKEVEYKKQLSDLQKELDGSNKKLLSKLTETETKLRTTEQAYHNDTSALQSEKAVIQQKLEFLQHQFDEAKDQLEEERRNHNSMMTALQGVASASAQEEVEQQLVRLREQYAEDLKKQEAEYSNTRKRLGAQIEELMQKNNALELKLKLEENDITLQNKQLNDQLTLITEERNNLKSRLQQLESSSNLLTEETEEKLRKRIQELETTIEDMQGKTSEEIAAVNAKSEQSLAHLKNYYEQEKLRLEQRLQEVKERDDRKYNLMCEEYEDRLRTDQEHYEDEIADMNDQLNELQAYHQDEISKFRHQAALDSQKIETLDKYLKETRDNLENLQKQYNASMEQQMESFNKERKVLLEKVEKSTMELTQKERDLTSLNYEKEKLENLSNSRARELEEFKAQFYKEKQTLVEKLEQAKSLYQQLGDEFNQKSSDYKRELALKSQSLEFQTKRISDLELSLQEAEERYNEAMKALKDETGQELRDNIQKLTAEKQELEQKLEIRKKALRELQTQNNKQVSMLEKEKLVLTEKLSNIEGKKAEVEERLRAEIESLQNQLRNKKDSDDSDKISIYTENERLKTLLSEIEKELNEKKASYDREVALWDNKFAFLTQQRDQARSDLAKAQARFDDTLEQLQKRGLQDKDRLESTTQSLISSIEGRYTNQIKDLQDTHVATVNELTEKIRVLERELRNIREELELEKRGHNSDQNMLEKQLHDLTDSEQRLLKEIDNLKRDRVNKMNEIQDTVNQEKEQLRGRIIEFERRAKEAEQSKGQLFLEQEKERTKWALEREHLVNQKAEMQDMIERLEKRKESLLRENEKLRADRGTRARGGVKSRDGKPPALGGIPSFLATAGISFEDFTKEKNENSESTTPQSCATPGEASPKPKSFLRMRAGSPLRRDRPPSGDWRNRLSRSRESKEDLHKANDEQGDMDN